MRWFSLIATLLLLSGCAVPATLSVASLVVGTGSYAISGKTVVDHGLSAALESDCALLRALEGSLCVEERHYELAESALTPLSGGHEGEGGDLDLALAGGPADGPEASPRSYRWLLDPAVQIAEGAAGPDAFAADYLAAEVAPGRPASDASAI